ncbi:MAG TPA: CBS domain-containing protein, partial [Methanomicrobiales archaeon]|nr:CBS domain-containing protein [Methanomicrobiales archaeon]
VPIREVMRPRATTINADATVAKAAETMCRDEVGSCIVLQHNMPIGIITEEDINCKVVAKDLKPGTIPVKEVMSTPLITISADRTVGDAAHMMVSNRVRRLPVVEGQKVVGIVTVRDILSVATVMNDIMTELITINREEPMEMGVCSRCGKMSDDLRRVDDQLILCPTCREEERLI